MGDRDIYGADIDNTPSNILGAACDYVNRAALDDRQKFHVGAAMGEPTYILPDGRHIQALQNQIKGKWHYSGRPDKAGIGLPFQRPPQKCRVSPKPQSSGVSPKRTKKKLPSSARKGTPNTKTIREGTY